MSFGKYTICPRCRQQDKKRGASYCIECCRIIKLEDYYKNHERSKRRLREYSHGKGFPSRVRKGALIRGLECTLTDSDIFGLRDVSCHYCGASPPNGIDRINNVLGYVKNNVVSCCKQCNRMKLTQTHNSFIEKCKCIVAHEIVENNPILTVLSDIILI